ncbi:MAG TPA: hypothetical protein VJN00_02030, partial [Steroidobacteraceae bacterium]|nr:hypothetical protein [Steroidobacteraceae bacterium]
MVNQQAILRRCRWIAPLVVTVLAGGSLVQAEWRVRPIASPYGLTDRDTTVVYRLEDSSGDLVTEPGVRFTLTVGGSGVFGSESGSGTILEGANTSRVVVEFEEGLVVLPLRDGTAESLDLFGSDPETRGIGFAGFYADFERDNGGFQPGANGWEWGAPTSGPRRAVSGERVWAT